MKISKRRPRQIGVLVGLILVFFSAVVYFFYSTNRESTFYDLLINRIESHQELLENNIGALNPSGYHLILTNEKYAIFDINGNAIYSSPGSPTKINKALLYALQVNAKGIHLGQNGDVQEVYELVSIANLKEKYIIFSSAYDLIGEQRQNFLLRVMFIGSLILSLFTYFLVSRVAKNDLYPLELASEQMGNINFENLSERVTLVNKENEVGAMVTAFNGVLDRLQKNIVQQQNFVSFVSHELRNPLAIIQGQSEVALFKERDKVEYIRVLKDIKSEVKDTILLVNDLLLLASVNVANTQVPFSEGYVEEAIWKAQSLVKKKMPEAEIVIDFPENIESEDFFLMERVNLDLLKIVFLNLMDNACKYSEIKYVKVKITGDENMLIFVFSDKGMGIPATELKSIFEPFYRASHTNTIQGHGLGLPLVKQIVDLHRGYTEIKSIVGEGTEVTVTLPKKINA